MISGIAWASNIDGSSNPVVAFIPLILISFVVYFIYKRFKAPPEQRAEVIRTKNWIGTLLIVFGMIALINAFGADTSVQTDRGSRVHNIGLINEQQNLIIVSGLAILVGFLINLFNRRKEPSKDNRVSGSEPIEGDRVKCPYCAELIKKEAVLCRYCGKNINES